jgi:hypothetical protein
LLILPWPVYRKGKGPRYPFSGKLCGFQNRSGICGEGKDFLSLAGIDPVFVLRLTLKCSQYKHWAILAARKYTVYTVRKLCVQLW